MQQVLLLLNCCCMLGEAVDGKLDNIKSNGKLPTCV
jgi:hypothetical protein